jgi:hypothetical protein
MGDRILKNAAESNSKPGPLDGVGDDFFVGMAEVRLAVDVINRRGDVKPFAQY